MTKPVKNLQGWAVLSKHPRTGTWRFAPVPYVAYRGNELKIYTSGLSARERAKSLNLSIPGHFKAVQVELRVRGR